MPCVQLDEESRRYALTPIDCNIVTGTETTPLELFI